MKKLCTHVIRGVIACSMLYASIAVSDEFGSSPAPFSAESSPGQSFPEQSSEKTLDLHYEGTMLAYDDSHAAASLSSDESPGDFGASNEEKAFKEPMFNGHKFHEYFGLGALALVGVAIVAPKEENGLHEQAAKASAALGAAAATTGLIFHWDDFHLEDGFGDPDNLHFLLGSLGTVGMLYAASKGPAAPHAAVGVLGAISMAVAVKITW